MSPSSTSMATVLRAWDTLERRELSRSTLSACAHASSAPEDMFYSVEESRAAGRKNRYRDVLAYDRSSVRVNGSDYLNANVVADGRGQWWVAAQAPLPNTFNTFFRAIHSRSATNSPAIPRSAPVADQRPPGKPRQAILVQLTGWTERGMIKADPYLPRSTLDEDALVFPGRPGDAVRLSMTRQTALDTASSTHSELLLESEDDEGDDVVIHHFYFDAWPDHGVPHGAGVTKLLQLLEAVYGLREENGGQDHCELWVHCSAGIGRTGTFIALMSLLHPPTPTPGSRAQPPSGSPLQPLKEGDEVLRVVDGLRDYRKFLVQTTEQLQMVYQVLAAKQR